ncbi:hypothetical protein ANN_10623 [Periplaneta americana]|uniref:Uncharacterized protein n=1 Tax=Periplaneta americana TaxID=6978 RepID=A0ABQ8T4F2_PERAM|nr:hypothetical protein ANN_10623 [Periplaneta americana]
MYSDMLKAATALKVFTPMCLAHRLQRVAEDIRAKFTQINFSDKKIFLKAPQQVLPYKQQLPEILQPLEPVLRLM